MMKQKHLNLISLYSLVNKQYFIHKHDFYRLDDVSIHL